MSRIWYKNVSINDSHNQYLFYPPTSVDLAMVLSDFMKLTNN